MNSHVATVLVTGAVALIYYLFFNDNHNNKGGSNKPHSHGKGPNRSSGSGKAGTSSSFTTYEDIKPKRKNHPSPTSKSNVHNPTETQKATIRSRSNNETKKESSGDSFRQSPPICSRNSEETPSTLRNGNLHLNKSKCEESYSTSKSNVHNPPETQKATVCSRSNNETKKESSGDCSGKSTPIHSRNSDETLNTENDGNLHLNKSNNDSSIVTSSTNSSATSTSLSSPKSSKSSEDSSALKSSSLRLVNVSDDDDSVSSNPDSTEAVEKSAIALPCHLSADNSESVSSVDPSNPNEAKSQESSVILEEAESRRLGVKHHNRSKSVTSMNHTSGECKACTASAEGKFLPCGHFVFCKNHAKKYLQIAKSEHLSPICPHPDCDKVISNFI